MAKTEATKDRSLEDKSLSYKEYRKELCQLHVELVKLQEWVVQTGSKVCIVFEGRDGAGRSSTAAGTTARGSSG
jgi:polyphosphate kinase